jgi:hypothetical protein
VPYKIHREVKPNAGGEPTPEGPAIGEFETKEEAEEFLRALVEEGIRDVYLVGHERPQVERR